MTCKAYIDIMCGITVAGVTTIYNTNAIPESLAVSKLPAMIPTLPVTAPGEQKPVILNLSLAASHGATYSVEWTIFVRPVGQKPPAVATAEMVQYLDAFLAAVRANDGAFPWNLVVLSPRAGVLDYAGTDYIAVVIPTTYQEVI